MNRVNCSTGSQVPASAKATALAISAATSLSMRVKVVGVNHVIGLKPSLEPHDGILVPPGFDFGLVAVELRIEH